MQPSAALDRMGSLTEELMAAHRELAMVLAAEKQAKVGAWLESQEGTVSARDRQSDFNALGLTVDALKLKGEINALEAERSYLTLILTYGIGGG